MITKNVMKETDMTYFRHPRIRPMGLGEKQKNSLDNRFLYEFITKYTANMVESSEVSYLPIIYLAICCRIIILEQLRICEPVKKFRVFRELEDFFHVHKNPS